MSPTLSMTATAVDPPGTERWLKGGFLDAERMLPLSSLILSPTHDQRRQ
jgi:hypothetical protein